MRSASLLDGRLPGHAYMSARVPVTFRESLDHFVELCTPDGCKSVNFEVADQAHLDRWANDDRADEIWQKIQKLLPPWFKLDPLDTIIPMVLVARISAQSAPNPKSIIDSHKRRSKQYLKRAEQLEELARVWRDAAKANHPGSKGALERAKAHEQEARGWRKASQKVVAKRRLLSRIDKSGSRKHRFFMKAVGEWIEKVCGRPLDGVTAVLNDIAFDTPEATTVFQARSARRPTTREARKNPKQKRPVARKNTIINQ
jgi:hypothetical protein